MIELAHLSEAQKRAYVLADNQLALNAGWDEALLKLELADLADLGFEMSLIGFGEGELERLLAGDDRQGLTDDDEVPEVPEQPVTQPGDLWVLGEHRLLCGDARDPESYARLLGGERCEAIWTDPPYGVAYQGKTKESLTIAGDGAAGLEALLSESFCAADPALAPGARLYVAHPAGALSLTFGLAFVGQGWRLSQTLVWVKDAFVLGRSDWHYRHEPIYYGHKPGEGRIGRGARGWFGDNAQDSVLEVPRPRASVAHPTMKPPELVERCLSNSTRRRDLVLDPFAGSGSTLVACERTGRAARLIELDPRFCDVVVGRWARLTGGRVERERP